MFVRRNGFLPFPRPSIGREEIDEVVDTLRSGWITTGLKTQRLEGAFGVYVGCRHAVALSSARGALHTGLAATRSGLTSFTLIMPKIRTRKRITNIQK